MLFSPREYTSLNNYREQMKQARQHTEPGMVYLDGSPVGSGKSFLNAQHVQKYESSRTLVKTHSAASETLETYQRAGVEKVATFPKLSKENCKIYPRAMRAQTLGLNVGASLCTGCRFSKTCEYRKSIHVAENAPHQILSHDRGRVRPASLDASKLIIIEEDAIDLLRPMFDASYGFQDVFTLAAWVLAELPANATDRNTRQQRFAIQQLQNTALAYSKLLEGNATPEELMLPVPLPKPRGLEKLLVSNIRRVKSLSGMALKICLGAVFGDWKRIVFAVDELWDAENRTRYPKPRIIAVGETKMPKNAEIWITDATARYTQVCTIFPSVENRTPQAKIKWQHPVRQVPIDVCKSSNIDDVSKLLKRLLAQYCDGEQVGLISHMEFSPDRLGMKNQLAMFAHFGGGATRSSNAWYRTVDRIIVLGTPRVAEHNVRSRMLQLGFEDELFLPHTDYDWQDGEWRRYKWTGETIDGRKAAVFALGYRRNGWRTAYEDLVHSEIDQAIGRGRGILQNGIPVIVVTTEKLGYPLLELPPRPEKLQPVYDAVCSGLKTVADIEKATGKSESTVRRCVIELENRGDVARESKRGRIFVVPPAPPIQEFANGHSS